MKRCPECRRDYYDDTLLYCLDDGNALLEGPASGQSEQPASAEGESGDEPRTAILHETAAPAEARTRAQIHTTEKTAVLPSGIAEVRKAGPFDKRPLLAFAALPIIVLGGFLGYRYFNAAGSGAIDSIAVLPFQNVSGDPNFEYLSDGIAESLINSLTQIQQLKVIARNTAFRYRDKDVDAGQVGKDLGVRAVLTGRVRQIGERLNIQVDLVDAATGAQLWGEEYDRPVSDALPIKQAIAREVTEKLRLRLSGEQTQQLVSRETSNSEAYQSYLRGRYYWNRRSADSIRKAITEFQQAIERDPDYALGYVGLADSFLLLEEYAGTPSSEVMPKARAAADRALQIDPTLGEAHASIAMWFNFQWQWAEAEEAFKKAIALNPKYPTARHWYSIYLRAQKRHAEGLKEMQIARELDPLAPSIGQNLAMMYMLNNDLDSAIREYKKVLELDPNFPSARANFCLVYVMQKHYDEAVNECQQGVDISGRSSVYLSQLGHAYGAMGKRAEAQQILKELDDRYAAGQSIGQYSARIHAALGDNDQAFAWLEKDFKARSGLLPTVAWWPFYEGLRSDPRYRDLLKRMNVPE